MKPRLLLLFGMPRSGTTWLGKAFDSHPLTIYRHEPDSHARLDDVPLVAAPSEADRYSASISEYAERLVDHYSVRVAGKLPIFPKQFFTPIGYQIHYGSVFLAKATQSLLGRELRILSPYRFNVEATPTVVWKSIESIGRLGVIRHALPQARAIFLLRHPCGQIASVLRGQQDRRFSDNQSVSQDYSIFEMLLASSQARAHGLTLKGLRKMRAVERLAWLWTLFNDKALGEVEQDSKTMIVRYEDVCEAPLETTRAMLDFARLSWHEQTRRFLDASTGTNHNAYYSVFKNARHSASRWRAELCDNDIAAIMAVVRASRAGARYADG